MTLLALGWLTYLALPMGPSETGLKGWVDVVIGDGPGAQAHRVDLASGTLRSLAPAPSYPYDMAVDGSSVLTFDNDIAVLDSQSGLRRIAPSPSLDWHPDLHPDGKRILFESARHAFRELYVVDIDGRNLRRLTHNPEGNFDGTWSPDGKQICFSSSRYGQLDLFVMSAKGTRQRRWTRHSGDAIRCSFGPDGDRIAYLSARDGRDDVLLIEQRGQPAKNLTRAILPTGRRVLRFAWHPTRNEMLVESVQEGGGGAVFWLCADSGRHRPLHELGTGASAPAWSPCGDWALFSRTSHPAGLVAVKLHTGESRRLHPVRNAWRPIWHRPPTQRR